MAGRGRTAPYGRPGPVDRVCITGRIVERPAGRCPAWPSPPRAATGVRLHAPPPTTRATTATPALLGQDLRDEGRVTGFRAASAARSRSNPAMARPSSGWRSTPCRTDQGHRQCANPADQSTVVGEVIVGHALQSLPLKRPQHRQLGTCSTGTITYNPARLHEHRQRQHEPAIRQRQPRAEPTTSSSMASTSSPSTAASAYQPSPDALADQRRDQQLLRRHRNVGGAVVAT